MILKRIPKIVFVVVCVISILVILPVIVYNIYAYQSSSRYVTAPSFVYNQEKGNIQYVPDPKSILMSFIGNEEYFNGYASLRYLGFEGNKVEIKMRNDSTGDDSIGATEDYIIAEKKEQGWTIVQHKTHWKCGRDFPFVFWTTHACS